MDLVAILDWFSRFVVAWKLDQTLELPFVLQAVDRSLELARPEIWNSDQGSHFTSPQYTQKLLDAQIQISMDGRGRAVDKHISLDSTIVRAHPCAAGTRKKDTCW